MDCSFLPHIYSLLFEKFNGRQSNTAQNTIRAVVHFVSSFSEFYSELVIFLIYTSILLNYWKTVNRIPFLSRLPSKLTKILSISLNHPIHSRNLTIMMFFPSSCVKFSLPLSVFSFQNHFIYTYQKQT